MNNMSNNNFYKARKIQSVLNHRSIICMSFHSKFTLPFLLFHPYTTFILYKKYSLLYLIGSVTFLCPSVGWLVGLTQFPTKEGKLNLILLLSEHL